MIRKITVGVILPFLIPSGNYTMVGFCFLLAVGREKNRIYCQHDIVILALSRRVAVITIHELQHNL